MDIIDIALEQYTDFSKFEQLANEIMAFEGYPHIMIIGGIDDEGIDAQEVKYYQDETKTTIFQYSLQKNVSSKIFDTVLKLLKNQINFSELIIVTNQQINNVSFHKRKIREKYKNKIKLEIYEKKTFITRLSSTHKNSFLRYFPDIKSQLNSDLFDKKTIFSDQSEDLLTLSLLKCSLLFTFNPNIERKRKDLFDNTILAILVETKKNDIIGVKTVFKNKFDKSLPDAQILSSFKRLQKNSLLDINFEKLYIPSKNAIEKIEGNISRVNTSTQALLDDIIGQLHHIFEKKIDKKTDIIIENNIKSAFSAFFRLHGVDYYSNNNTPNIYFNWDISNEQDLIKITKENLSQDLGDVLVYCIGETIKNPTDEQANILAQWAKAFLCVQIMGLDPILNDFQINKISEKVFILDTDFLLYSIVDNCGISKVYKKLISELLKLNCELIIPEAVIYEVIRHAEFATRNYNYFKNTFDTVDEIIVEEKISNVFVKDFYISLVKNKIDIDFKYYLSNYYDKEASYEYMKDIIRDKLPTKIKIKEISSLLPQNIPPQEIIEKLTDEIYNETIKTFKSLYRDKDENRKIAKNDANFYLTTYFLNKNLPRNKNNKILNGKYYLLTSSNRPVRCARKLKIYDDVIVKPNTLINLLENIGLYKSSTQDIINLLENPFLAYAIDDNWRNIKDLIDTGVDLKGKSITRLKWDLDEQIHKYLSKDKETKTEDESFEENKGLDLDDDTSLDDYINFIKQIKSKGYKFIPKVEKLIKKYEEIKDDVEQKEKVNAELEKEIKKFGKRRQHYFNKIKRRKK